MEGHQCTAAQRIILKSSSDFMAEALYDPYWVIAPPRPALGIWDLLGLIGALSAVTVELVADRQLRNYRETGEYNQGGIFRRGSWKYSRHPDYFGESLFWVSMVPFAVSSGMLSRHVALVVVGPALMALFFRFSCRLMDLRSLQHRPGYQ